MTIRLQHRDLPLLLLPGIFLLLLLSLTAFLFLHDIKLNLTDSMPIGFYQKITKRTIERGDLVSTCLPKSVAEVGLERGYLSHGGCPGGAIPVLKKVIALPGDKVVWNQQIVMVNGQSYFSPEQTRDHFGDSVIHWIPQSGEMIARGYWLYGANDPKESWDSRYFGAVKQGAIRGIYWPFWVFKNT